MGSKQIGNVSRMTARFQLSTYNVSVIYPFWQTEGGFVQSQWFEKFKIEEICKTLLFTSRQQNVNLSSKSGHRGLNAILMISWSSKYMADGLLQQTYANSWGATAEAESHFSISGNLWTTGLDDCLWWNITLLVFRRLSANNAGSRICKTQGYRPR